MYAKLTNATEEDIAISSASMVLKYAILVPRYKTMIRKIEHIEVHGATLLGKWIWYLRRQK